MSLKHMRVAHKLKFSCDMCKSCKAFICRHHRPEVYHDDITTRAPEEEQYVDLYLYTPPCTSFSISGKQLGTAGEGKVLKHSLKYIQRQRPRVAVMENVKNLTPKKFKPVVAGIHACLKKLGYTTYQSTLNAMCYGVPQSRERVFFVSIRNDSKVHKFSWPAALRTRTIESALDPVLPSDRAGRLPKHIRAQELCKTAYKRCLKDKGVNALEIPGFGRCGLLEPVRNIWCEHRANAHEDAWGLRRPVGLDEGAPDHRQRNAANPRICAGAGGVAGVRNITHSHREMAGNSVPVPLIGCVLAEAMYAGGLVATKPSWE